MSGHSFVKTVGLPELSEWLESLGLLDVGEPGDAGGGANGGSNSGGNSGEEEFRNKLRDGIALCQLVNKVRPGYVDNVRKLDVYFFLVTDYCPNTCILTCIRSSQRD